MQRTWFLSYHRIVNVDGFDRRSAIGCCVIVGGHPIATVMAWNERARQGDAGTRNRHTTILLHYQALDSEELALLLLSGIKLEDFDLLEDE